MLKHQAIKGSLFIVVFLLLLVAVACSKPAPEPTATPAQVFKWTGQSVISPGTAFYDLHTKFADRVAARTGGRMIIKIVPAGGLGIAAGEILNSLKQGVVPISELTIAYHANMDPWFSYPEMPFLVKDWNEARKMREIAAPYMQKVYENWGVVPLLMITAGEQHLFSSTPLVTLDDFKGKKIRTYGNQYPALITALGASPVSMPLTDVPESVGRGMVQGLVCGVDAAYSLKMDQIKYITNPMFWIGNDMPLVANAKQFYALPKDIQQALLDVSNDMQDEMYAKMKAGDTAALEAFQEHGVKLTQLSPEVLANIKATAQPLKEKWLAGTPMAADYYKKLVAALGHD